MPMKRKTKKTKANRQTFSNSAYAEFDPDYAEDLRVNYPSIWAKGGNIRGNAVYKLWRKAQRGEWTPAVTKWAVQEREAWAARHQHDHRLPGIVAAIKWGVVLNIGERAMKEVVDAAKSKLKSGN